MKEKINNRMREKIPNKPNNNLEIDNSCVFNKSIYNESRKATKEYFTKITENQN
jgi:hypothetical protein